MWKMRSLWKHKRLLGSPSGIQIEKKKIREIFLPNQTAMCSLVLMPPSSSPAGPYSGPHSGPSLWSSLLTSLSSSLWSSLSSSLWSLTLVLTLDLTLVLISGLQSASSVHEVDHSGLPGLFFHIPFVEADCRRYGVMSLYG